MEAEVARRQAQHVPPFKVNVAAGGFVTAGLTSEPGPGIWAGVALQTEWLSVGLEMRGVFPAVTVTYEPGRQSYATAISGAVVPCLRLRVVSACVFAEVGSFLFTIPGRSPANLDTLVAVGPRAAVDAPLPDGLSLRVFADLAFHPYLPVFDVRTTSAPDAPVATWTMPVISGLLGAGLTWSR